MHSRPREHVQPRPLAAPAGTASSVFWLLLCFSGDPSPVKGKKGLGWGGQQTAWLGPLGTSAPEAGPRSFPCEARGLAVTLSQSPVASFGPSQFLFLTHPLTLFLPEGPTILRMGCLLLGQLQGRSACPWTSDQSVGQSRREPCPFSESPAQVSSSLW